MRLKAIGVFAGLALLALPVTGAFAHTDVSVDFDVAVPAPPGVYIEAEAPYYAPPRPVYYHPYWHPWYGPRVYWRDHDWDDRGWRRGWHDHDRGWRDRGWRDHDRGWHGHGHDRD